VGVRDASGVVADDGARRARHEPGHHDHAETYDSQAPAGGSLSNPASLLHAAPPHPRAARCCFAAQRQIPGPRRPVLYQIGDVQALHGKTALAPDLA
jgi:hypothetical protein